MNRNKRLKLIVPFLMVLGIFIIWYMQNSKENTHQVNTIKVENKNDTVTKKTDSSDIFALSVKQVDLELLKSYNLPIIIDFGADSCIPCKAMAPILVQLNQELREKAFIKFVDVWKNRGSTNGFPIKVIPTQVFYTADGKAYIPSEELKAKMNFTMYYDEDSKEHIFTIHQGGLNEEQLRAIIKDMGVN